MEKTHVADRTPERVVRRDLKNVESVLFARSRVNMKGRGNMWESMYSLKTRPTLKLSCVYPRRYEEEMEEERPFVPSVLAP